MTYQSEVCSIHKCLKKRVNTFWICKECSIINLKNEIDEHNLQLSKDLIFMKINMAQIPLDLKDKDLNNYTQSTENDRKNLEISKLYVEHILENKAHSNLLITGPTGVGKSHLAVGILKYCYELKFFGHSIHYSTSSGLANKVFETWNDPNLKELDVVNNFVDTHFLIIDDLGYDDFGKKAEIVNKIIYLRHEMQKSTIITSNLKLDQLVEYMCSRTRSRFFSHLYCNLEVNNEDFRLKR